MAEPWQVALIVGLAAPVLGFLGNLVAEWLRKRKTTAETDKTHADAAGVVTSSAIALINELQDEVKELRDSNKSQQAVRDAERIEYQRRIAAMENEIMALRAEIAGLKLEVRDVHRREGELRQGIAVLIQQLETAKLAPDWIPGKHNVAAVG